jgi:N-acetyl-gamma-glutamyl-phosphate reductase
MKRIGIVNVTGYAGAEAARLLARHPGVEIAWVTGRSEAGKRLATVFPHLREIDQVIAAEPAGDVDLAILALPHHASAEAAGAFLDRGVKLVDISADFRLRDLSVYEEFYGAHPAPRLLAGAVYGLPEVYRQEIRVATLVANPGCYPTASILALLPALREGIIGPGLVVDAKSGVSGAGRSLALSSHFSEVDESIKAYGLDGHRHLPEIAQELQVAAGQRYRVRLTFIPHLIPMTRGILATAYADLAADWPVERVREAYREFYAKEPFVRVVDEPPQSKQVWGSNYCHVYPTVDRRAGRLVVVSVIDNLVKGAAGQAVQNANLMLGLPEAMGLESLPYYP